MLCPVLAPRGICDPRAVGRFLDTVLSCTRLRRRLQIELWAHLAGKGAKGCRYRHRLLRIVSAYTVRPASSLLEKDVQDAHVVLVASCMYRRAHEATCLLCVSAMPQKYVAYVSSRLNDGTT